MTRQKKEILGIVTARGGSKSIPRKNVKSFLGKPLLAWTADAGIKSGVFSRFILTTDDKEIAASGKKVGLEVPFMRPAELAEDNTPSLAVLQHAVQWLKDNEGYYPDYVVLLEPTSPGRMPFHIKEAIDLLVETQADSVVSVAQVPGHYSPHWQFHVNDKGNLKVFTGEEIRNIIRRRQELPKTYYRNGAIYAFRPDLLFKKEPSLYGDRVSAYVMDAKYSFDIDTMEEWIAGESLLKKVLE